MSWVMKEKKGISWTDQTLASISAPPLPLLGFFVLIILILSLSSFWDKKEQIEISLKMFLYLIPVVLIIVLHVTMGNKWWVVNLEQVPRPTAAYEVLRREGSSACGVALVVALLLVMVYYHSSVQSAWFRPI